MTTTTYPGTGDRVTGRRLLLGVLCVGMFLVQLDVTVVNVALPAIRSKLQTAPHVTTLFEVDLSRVWAHWQANMGPYEQQGVKLTLTAYFVAAMVKAFVGISSPGWLKRLRARKPEAGSVRVKEVHLAGLCFFSPPLAGRERSKKASEH